MTRRLKISILAALFAGGTILGPAMAEEVNNDAESDSTATNDNNNESTNDNTNESSSDSSSTSEASNDSDVCLLLCGVLSD